MKVGATSEINLTLENHSDFNRHKLFLPLFFLKIYY